MLRESAWAAANAAKVLLSQASDKLALASAQDLPTAQAAYTAAFTTAQAADAALLNASNHVQWDTTIAAPLPASSLAAQLPQYSQAFRAAERSGQSAERRSVQAGYPDKVWCPRGSLRDVPDDRDRLYTPPSAVAQNLPARVDLRLFMPPVYMQLGESCTANSLAAAVQFLSARAGRPAPEPSTQFLYYNARVLAGQQDQECGTASRDNIKAVARFGLPAYDTWPNRSDTVCERPSPVVYGLALQQVVSSYARISLNLSHMKSCLAEGFPFLASVSRFNEAGEGSGALIMPNDAELAAASVGGHSILIVGFDDASQTFLFRNSWGHLWGDQGYGWMPYAYLLNPRLTEDCWTVRAENALDQPTAPA